jgi:hypothetical protein
LWTSQHFTELKGSLLSTSALHWSLTGASSIQSKPPHPISVRSIHFDFLVVYFHLNSPPLSYMHSFSQHLCYIPRPSDSNSNYTWQKEQVMKLLIMQFSPTFCHFISLQSKYSQHPVLKHPQSMFHP